MTGRAQLRCLRIDPRAVGVRVGLASVEGGETTGQVKHAHPQTEMYPGTTIFGYISRDVTDLRQA